MPFASFDVITRYFASVDDPLIVSLSSIFDSYIVFIYLFMFLIFARFLERERLVKAVLTILLSLTLTFLLKYAMQVPRPCMLDPSYTKLECPSVPDYSFPSGHTAISSSFMAAFVGTPPFVILLVLNLLVGFSRLNLGVHFLNDVIASFVIGFFSFDIIDRLTSNHTLTISKPRENTSDKSLEVRRQLLHMLVGIIVIIGIYFTYNMSPQNGLVYAEFVIFLGLQIILLIMDNFLQNKQLGNMFKPVFSIFERRGVKPGYGAFWYGMGILFSLVFIHEINMVVATVIALGIGDGLATIIGVRGKLKNPLNPKKTIEGSLAFFLSTALLTYPLLGMVSLPFAFITALVESLPPKFDDNFTIPLVSILFSFII